VTEQQYRTPALLTVEHEVGDFDCGSIRETTWLRRHGLSAQHSGSSRTYAVRGLDDDGVIGFHALATGVILPLEARDSVTQGGDANPVSVIVLTHLGVDLRGQSQGLGRYLVSDAIRRVNAAADLIGARALLIHTPDARARNFFLALAEFETSPTDPLHLFLSMKDLRHSLP
jgi:GNAT superfamily N-acetyltransferase